MNRELLESCRYILSHLDSYTNSDLSVILPEIIGQIDAELSKPSQSEDESRKIGKALNRAAKELPIGYDMEIHLENGAGWIELYFPDHDANMFEGDSLDMFSSKINHAIDQAISDNAKEEESK